MRAHMIFHDLGHESRHGAACACDEVHDLLAASFPGKRTFYAVNLSAQAPYPRQQLFSITDRVAHRSDYSIPTHPIYA